MKYTAYTEWSPAYQEYRIYLTYDNGPHVGPDSMPGRFGYALPLTWKEHKFGGEVHPFVVAYSGNILDSPLPALAQLAWDNGWRPEKFKTEDTTATIKHLEDMRLIAFVGLGMDRPEDEK